MAADVCVGSKTENLTSSKCFPLRSQHRTSPSGSAFRRSYEPNDFPLAEFKLALLQPSPEQLAPESEPVCVHHVRAAVTLFKIGQNLTFAGDRFSRSFEAITN